MEQFLYYADSYVFWIFVFLWILATNFKEGMWGNCLLCLDLFFATLFAFGAGIALLNIEAVASYVTNAESIYVAVLVGWAIFSIPFLVFLVVNVVLSNKISKTQVRFPRTADMIGAMFFIALPIAIFSGAVSKLWSMISGGGAA